MTDVTTVLELADRYALESEIPSELKEAVRYCIAKKMVRIQPVAALLDLDSDEMRKAKGLPLRGKQLFPERRTPLIGPGHMPMRLLLRDDGEAALAEHRIGSEKDAPTLKDRVMKVLSTQQQKLMEHLLKKETASFNKLRMLPGAFRGNVSDEAIIMAVKRIRERLEKADLPINLVISGERLNLERYKETQI